MSQVSINPVPVSAIAAMGIAALVGAAMFLGLLIYSRKKYGTLKPFLVGCGTFVLFALVLESLVHQIVFALFPAIAGSTILYALYGGFAAGLFEETGRLVAMKWLHRKADIPATALNYGFGHGGIEILIVLSVGMVQYIAYAVLINTGAVGQLLDTLEGADQSVRDTAIGTLQSLSQVGVWNVVLSAAERVSAVVLHVSLSVFVWKAVVGRKWGYYIAAIALHALFDAIAVILARNGVSTIVTEIVVAAMALAAAAMAYKLYKNLQGGK